MQTHYNLPDSVFSELTEKNSITTMDFLTALKWFCPHDREVQISKISLLFYIDAKGDFTDGNEKHKKIARAIFSCLSGSEKVEVLGYLQWHEDQISNAEENDDGDKDHDNPSTRRRSTS